MEKDNGSGDSVQELSRENTPSLETQISEKMQYHSFDWELVRITQKMKIEEKCLLIVPLKLDK